MAQPIGHRPQQTVTHAVAQHVVDVLEAIEVEHQHGTGRRAARPCQQGRAQIQAELRPVRQVGQRVFVGQAPDFAGACLQGHAHRFERLREFTDLVVAGQGHGGVVVALLQSARRA